MKFNEEKKIAYISKPVGILLLILLIFIVSVVMFFTKISALNLKLQDEKALEHQLNTKISILQSVPQEVSDNITFADMALPGKESFLLGLNLVKEKAMELGLILNSLKISSASEVDQGVYKSVLNFDLSGDENQMYTFLTFFGKTLPLSTLEKVQINRNNESTTMNISVNFYSSIPLTKIPAVSGKIDELTESESKVLIDLSAFEVPTFNLPSSSQQFPREDPFN